jgi:hypothetical protein
VLNRPKNAISAHNITPRIDHVVYGKFVNVGFIVARDSFGCFSLTSLATLFLDR